MRIMVKPHFIDVQSNPINELEINVTKCYFEFSEEITNDFVKEAYFTLDDGETYKKIIINNECDIPNEVLVKNGTIEIGVVTYLVENEEEIKRYNPKPGYFTSWEGSLKDAENSEPITPSEMEQFEQALENGLAEVANVDIGSEQLSNGTSVTITDRTGTSKTTYVYNGQNGRDGIDGKDGQNGRDGTNGITPTIGNNGNWYLGEIDTGKPSRGATGANGQNGVDGKDAKINGVNTLTMQAGNNITLNQQGNTLTISATGGSGGTTDYTDLTNKPKINNVELSGNKTTSDLGIVIPTVPTNVSAFTNDAGYLTQHQDISGKLDVSKVKNVYSATSGDVYDVVYFNSIIGDINTILDNINGEVI